MKIYISHCIQDANIAAIIKSELTKSGYEIIGLSEEPLEGLTFKDKINKYLKNANIVIAIFTMDSINSNDFLYELSLVDGYDTLIFPLVFGEIKLPLYLQTNSSLHIYEKGLLNDNLTAQKIIKQIIMFLNKYQGEQLAQKREREENKEKIDQSVTDYTKGVFEKLDKNENRDRRLAYFCYIASTVFLIASAAFSIFKTISYDASYNLQQVVHYLISNILTLAIMVALSRLAFVLGKSFMVESIRNGDRIHAISFGKFFLNAYGNVATRDEIREVFQSWNIDKGSSFMTQDTKDFDPQILGALEIIKSAIKK